MLLKTTCGGGLRHILVRFWTCVNASVSPTHQGESNLYSPHGVTMSVRSVWQCPLTGCFSSWHLSSAQQGCDKEGRGRGTRVPLCFLPLSSSRSLPSPHLLEVHLRGCKILHDGVEGTVWFSEQIHSLSPLSLVNTKITMKWVVVHFSLH